MVTEPSHPAGRRAVTARLPAAGLCLALALGACQAGPTGPPDPPAGPAADLVQLRTDNDLLYPPELWNVLDPSPRGEVLRNQALQAVGEPVRWSGPPAALYERLRAETDDLTAAALLAEAGLDPPVTAAAVADWAARWQPVATGTDLDRLWRTLTVARRLGVDLTLHPDTVTAARDLLADPSPLRQWQAAQLLAAAGHEPQPPPAGEWLRLLERTDTPQDPQTAAAELYAWVMLHHDRPDFRFEPDYWQPLADWAPTQDDTYAYLVRAYAAAGETERARRLAARFDQRRLRADGSVLEPPVFSGSVGSTFRMLRWLRHTPTGLEELPEAGRVETAVRRLLDRDTGHRVAGLASLQLLGGPDAVPPEERRAAVAAALDDLGVVAGEPLNLEATMGWISVAEYASVLQVDLEFPGLSPEALRTLLEPGELDPHGDDALYAVARLVLALVDTGHRDAAELPTLAEHLRAGLADRDPAETHSLLLLGGSLALLRLDQPPPVPATALSTEISQRSGDCLGGFHSFVRELRQVDTACNVDATRYALLVLEAIDAA